MKTLLVVAIALINDKGEILLAQRPAHKSLPGSWEFPGGKVEKDESPEQALVREIKEELDIDISAEHLEPFWFLSHDYIAEFGFHLLMPVYVCRHWQGTPRAVEHAALAWKHPGAMRELGMIEADMGLVEKLIAAER